jgi:putative zinc finger protein
MQHLDEGTIHSWLDGALSGDKAARVEAHVKECPQCASVVAEARGFIAASSRILTALDHAPRGVVPIAAPKRRVDPLVWRVAATVLVVAAGTLAVVRNRESTEPMKAISADQATTLSLPTEGAIERGSDAATAAAANGVPSNVAASEAPATALLRRAGTQTSRPDVNAPEKKSLAEGEPARAGKIGGASGYTGAVTQTVPTIAAPAAGRSRMAGVAAMDAATEQEPLKVVGTPRRIGAKVTLYEVAPGDTVTLTESIPSYLSSVVVTGAAVAPTAQAAGAVQKSAAAPSKARADAPITNAREVQAAGGVAAPAPAVSAPAPSAQTETTNTLNTITWNDSATGNTLSLTGRMPQSRLRAIRMRIERERAAAAKKNP